MAALRVLCLVVACLALASAGGARSARSQLVLPNRVLNRWADLVDPYIVGGDAVDITELPHQLSLQLYSHICGASIISSTFAVTAGHCAAAGVTPKNGMVRAGSSTQNKGGVTYSLRRVVNNPKYESLTVDFDVAVLEIDGAFDIGATMRPIALPEAGEEIPAGSLLTVSGWGYTMQGGLGETGVQRQLRQVSVLGLTQKACSVAYGGSLTARMMCAGRSGTDSCQGDSGGPLIHKKDDGSAKLVGIVSWGYGCAKPGIPGVYARPSDPDLRAFIKSVSGV